jgi:hypothetical protein
MGFAIDPGLALHRGERAMVNLSHSHPEHRTGLFGLAREMMHSLTSAFADRRIRYTRESSLETLQLVEPGLLGEDAAPAGRRGGSMEELARVSPAVVAAGVFCLPRR